MKPLVLGSRGRMQADLAQMILQAAADTGFMALDKDSKPIPGEGGTLGYLRWCALHEPKTYMGMLTRVLPYHVVEEKSEDRILSRDEAIEELKERGLPIEMLAMLRAAPAPLDPGEVESLYGQTIAALPAHALNLAYKIRRAPGKDWSAEEVSRKDQMTPKARAHRMSSSAQRLRKPQ